MFLCRQLFIEIINTYNVECVDCAKAVVVFIDASLFTLKLICNVSCATWHRVHVLCFGNFSWPLWGIIFTLPCTVMCDFRLVHCYSSFTCQWWMMRKLVMLDDYGSITIYKSCITLTQVLYKLCRCQFFHENIKKLWMCTDFYFF